MKLNEKIKILRKARGLSQEELGLSISNESYGVSRQAVYAWENGTSEPKLENIKEIAKVLSVSYDVLLDESISLDNEDILQSVLNGSFNKTNCNLKHPISINVYRSYKWLYFFLGLCIVFALASIIFCGVKGLEAIQSAKLSIETQKIVIESPEMGSSPSILGGISDIKSYLSEEEVATQNGINALGSSLASSINALFLEVNQEIVGIYRYMIVVSIIVLAILLLVLVLILLQGKKRLASISQNSIILHGKRFCYIPLEEVSNINQSKTGINIELKDGNSHHLHFIRDKEQILSFYNQIRLFKENKAL